MRYLVTMTIDVEELPARGPGRPRKTVPEPAVVQPPAPAPAPAPHSRQMAYSVPEAALALGVSKSSVWKLIKEGDLPAVKLGRRTLISAEALQTLLDGLKGR
ncbi:MAG TPA: helix-turn-helix domain-containing protein [Geothrix sp.]